MLIGVIIMYVVTLIVVGGRLCARFFVQRSHGLDDYLIIATMVWHSSDQRDTKLI